MILIFSNLTITDSWGSGLFHSHGNITLIDSIIQGSKGASQLDFSGGNYNATIIRTHVIDAGQGGTGLGDGNQYGIYANTFVYLNVIDSNVSNNSNIKMTNGTAKDVGYYSVTNPIVAGILANKAVIENSIISNDKIIPI